MKFLSFWKKKKLGRNFLSASNSEQNVRHPKKCSLFSFLNIFEKHFYQKCSLDLALREFPLSE